MPSICRAPRRPPSPTSPLRHLPSNAQGLRLAGEIASSEWPVYLTEAQAAHPLKFQLGYLSAVSVMPEASTLQVQINDVTIGELHLHSPSKVKITAFDVPSELVRPGFNAVRLVVQQRHRVDCSIAATYELWTQIDSSQTGFLIAPRDMSVTSIVDLAALPANPQGALPIRAMLPGATDAGNVNRLLRAVQLVAWNGRFEQPIVDVGAAAGGIGVNLAVGTYGDLRGMAGLEMLQEPLGPHLELFPATAATRSTLVITGVSVADVDIALARLAAEIEPNGTPAGLRAAFAFPGYRLDSGQHVRMRDLGVISQEFSGRLFRTAFNIVLPADFYPADYGKVEIRLAGGYAPNLTGDAQIVLSVNSKIAVGTKMAKIDGEVFRNRTISVPLSLLRPGLNRIDLEAHVPTKEDASCDPLAAIGAKNRFLFLDDTEFVLPHIARIAQMPNLAITTTGGFPYASAAQAPYLYLPSPSRETIGAAATLIARMAVSAGSALNFRLTVSAPALDDGSTLVVGALPGLQSAVLGVAGLDPEAMRRAWPVQKDDQAPARPTAVSRFEALARTRLALQNNHPAECRLRPFGKKAAPPQASLAQPRTDSAKFDSLRPEPARAEPKSLAQPNDAEANLFSQWRTNVKGTKSWWPTINISFSGFGDLIGWTRAKLNSARDQITAHVDSDPVGIISADTTLVVSQRNYGASGAGVWTLVTAPTPAQLAENVACLVDPRVWNQVQGQTASLDPNDAAIHAVSTNEPRFVTTQPLSFQNTRLIAAGWFSINRWFYVGLLLGIAALLGTATYLFVAAVGRRQ